MRVTSGYVYLCGQTKSNTGFIGYMDISSIASLSSTATLNYMEIPQTTCLVSMAAYSLGMMTTVEKVVAVGYNSASYVDHYIVEVNNILGGSGFYRYTTVPNEVLHEVFEVASGVVFVGYSRDCGTLTLRKGDWNNAVTTSAVQTRYCYTSSEEVHARTISDTDFSKIAVSYLHYDRPSDVYSTRIRYIDLATMQMENSQEFFTGEKSGPVAMTHVPYLNSPILLQPFTYPATGPLSTKSPFILLDRNATSSYSAQVLYHPGKEYSSLHYCGGSFFAACAYGKLYYQDVSLPMTSSFTCIMEGTLPVNRIDDLPTQTAVTPMVPVNTASTMRTVSCVKNNSTMLLDCTN